MRLSEIRRQRGKIQPLSKRKKGCPEVSAASGGYSEPEGLGCERGTTFEQSENGAASTLPPAGATTGQRGFAAGEMEPNGGKHRFLRSENRDEIEEVRGGEATRVQPATARAGGLPPSNKPCEEVPRPICHGSGKHRVFRGAKTETKLRRCRDQYAMGAANTVFRGAETEMKSRR